VAQDLVDEAFKELRGRKDLDEEYQRLKKAEARWGY
jgi:cell division protein FtsL